MLGVKVLGRPAMACGISTPLPRRPEFRGRQVAPFPDTYLDYDTGRTCYAVPQ